MKNKMPAPKRVSMSALEFDKKIIDMATEDERGNNSEKIAKIRKILLKVIENDLTARQKQIIMLYYYKEMSVNEIAECLHIDHSSVSRTLKRARENIFKLLKYYF